MSSKKLLPFERRKNSRHICSWISAFLLCFAGEVSGVSVAPTYPYLEWTREQHASATDVASDVAADSLGNIFITGETYGPLGGSSQGRGDAFLSRYDSAGDRKWTINIGSRNYDIGWGVSADNLGNVYVAGGIDRYRFGTDPVIPRIFLQKYDSGGSLTWSRSFEPSMTDEARDVVVDRLGNVFVAGWTLGNLAAANVGDRDVFVSRFNAQGDHLWTRQIGSDKFDEVHAASADGLGNVYVSGVTTGLFGGTKTRSDGDVFLAKFDVNGNHKWTRQIGNQSDQLAGGMAVDGMGNAYLAGITNGNWGGPNGGGNPTNPYDGFLVKFDSDGDQKWLRQFGGPSYDSASGVAVDQFGNVYVSGHSNSNLPGTDADGDDAFVMKFNASGVMQWTTQGGPRGHDQSVALATDGRGNLYSAGYVDRGNLPFSSNYDVFVAKIVIPEPTAAGLILTGLTCGVWSRRRTVGDWQWTRT